MTQIRCKCVGHQREKQSEYFVLIILIAIALATFNINNSGGVLTQFNRLIASPSGVQHIYNESGSTHLIKANIKGVRTSDRSRVAGQFLIIQAQGTGFLVQADDGRIYKASTEPDSQIFLEEITADVGKPAITNIEAISIEDEPIGEAIAQFNRAGAMVFISGQLSVEDLETSVLPRDPYQFPVIKATDSTVILEAAPLSIVQKTLGDEFATGQLQVRVINSSSQ
ncbi:hypothetical protein [Nostoc linckia]|uniref:hypothetical protein n=1 Tax=Nostoc linckia TaxID=92942 RepID=UPI0015D4D366|nr:hypothetical protein [Nostoc linckia]